ncbi:MAG: adenosine deaminase [Acidobacteria bacterium]|nr:adenosine deaminase [Acidobacteriota bacterium]MBI3657654.1 adenosine deaminase [Acidobacteriota bacterium]
MSDALFAFIDRLPKVELHLHLEGSIPVHLLKRLSGYAREDLDELYHYANFYDFLMAFKKVCRLLREPADFELVTYELLAHLARQNVCYSEVFFSPSIHRRNGLPLEPVFCAIYRAAAQAKMALGIEMAILLDCVRQWGELEAGYVLDLAMEHRKQGVVGIGIGGDELAAPPETFRKVYEAARAGGLHTVAHAGEVAGPASVWGAVHALKAERIGHGLSVAQDDRLLAHCREKQLPLEMSLTGNVMTGAVASLAQHPFRRLFDAGLALTLNSDDPAMFSTTLTAEYRLLATHFGFSADELRRVAQTAVRAAFLPDSRKTVLLERLEQIPFTD